MEQKTISKIRISNDINETREKYISLLDQLENLKESFVEDEDERSEDISRIIDGLSDIMYHDQRV